MRTERSLGPCVICTIVGSGLPVPLTNELLKLQSIGGSVKTSTLCLVAAEEREH